MVSHFIMLSRIVCIFFGVYICRDFPGSKRGGLGNWRGTRFRVSKPRFLYKLNHRWIVPWKCFLTSLSLCFLICEKEKTLRNLHETTFGDASQRLSALAVSLPPSSAYISLREAFISKSAKQPPKFHSRGIAWWKEFPILRKRVSTEMFCYIFVKLMASCWIACAPPQKNKLGLPFQVSWEEAVLPSLQKPAR